MSGIEGTIKPSPEFDPDLQAKYFQKAMRGLGTNEQQIREIMATHDNVQRCEISKVYKQNYGKELVVDLKDELGGHFEDLCVALLTPKKDFDAFCLHRALKGAGTDEKCLIEILCSRTNEEIETLKESYANLPKNDWLKKAYGGSFSENSLEDDVIGDTSGDVQKILVSLLQGQRETGDADEQKAELDARELLDAGENMVGTDEAVFNKILSRRSPTQLRAIFNSYEKIAGKPLERSIVSETSGVLRDIFLGIVTYIKDPMGYFSERLFISMDGHGTDDKSLIRLIVSRSEIDLKSIKDEYFRRYNVFLSKHVAGDTSGDYKKLLLQIIGTD